MPDSARQTDQPLADLKRQREADVISDSEYIAALEAELVAAERHIKSKREALVKSQKQHEAAEQAREELKDALEVTRGAIASEMDQRVQAENRAVEADVERVEAERRANTLTEALEETRAMLEATHRTWSARARMAHTIVQEALSSLVPPHDQQDTR
jgi:predicted  nucleic acid-binding Zn-ribbon protein